MIYSFNTPFTYSLRDTAIADITSLWLDVPEGRFNNFPSTTIALEPPPSRLIASIQSKSYNIVFCKYITLLI